MTEERQKTGFTSNFKGDIYGGITSGIIALPLSLAFGVASGVGAAAGLYGAIIVGFFAAIFGGTRTQISGPTGPITVIVAAIVATHPGEYGLIFTTIFLAGLIQIGLGFTGLGKLIRYVPYPVISGFMSGIGIIIIVIQLNPLLGLESSGTPLMTILSMIDSLQNINWMALVLGVITVIMVFNTPAFIRQYVPAALLALIVVTIGSVLLNLDVPRIGSIPSGLPEFHMPSLLSFESFEKMLPIAFTIAILGSVDSLLTSLVADSLTRTRHDSNKELIGQGIGNTVAGLFGGLAGAGATMRTVVNIKTGGTTQISGALHAVLLLVILLVAAPLAEQIPMAVLAGILIKVGFDIIDYKFIKVIKHAPKYDLYVMLLVFILTVFDDLIFAVGVGIVLSSILFAYRISQQTDVVIKKMPKEYAREVEVETELLQDMRHQIRVVHIDGIFFFGSTSRITMRVDDILGTKYMILDCRNLENFDISAVFALEDMIVRLKDKGINVMLILAYRATIKQAIKFGIKDLVGKENIFFCEEKAIQTAKERYKEENKKRVKL